MTEPADAVDAPTLARWLGVSGKTVYELAKSGIVVQVGKGRFDLEASVRGYCEHLRRQNPRPTGRPPPER